MWGYHLTVDCAGCSEAITDKASLVAFADEMVRSLGMRAHGEPVVVRFGDDPKVTGYTLVQLIETSNISGHFCDYSGEAYIDVFSCREFAVETAVAVIHKHFAPKEYVTTFQARQAPGIPAPAE